MPAPKEDPVITDTFTTPEGYHGWHVTSQSQSDWLYTVIDGEFAITCNCKWATYRSGPDDKPCAHRRVVEERLQREGEQALAEYRDRHSDVPAHERAGPVVHNRNRPFSLWKNEEEDE